MDALQAAARSCGLRYRYPDIRYICGPIKLPGCLGHLRSWSAFLQQLKSIPRSQTCQSCCEWVRVAGSHHTPGQGHLGIPLSAGRRRARPYSCPGQWRSGCSEEEGSQVRSQAQTRPSSGPGGGPHGPCGGLELTCGRPPLSRGSLDDCAGSGTDSHVRLEFRWARTERQRISPVCARTHEGRSWDLRTCTCPKVFCRESTSPHTSML